MGGLVKAISKAVRQVTKPLTDIVKPDMPKVEPQQQAAQVIEPPKPESTETEDEAQTEAGRKKAARGGKKSLSVARASGGGLNI